MDREKVLNLARLSRIAVSDAEADKLSSQFDSILAYVDKVKEVRGGNTLKKSGDFSLKNVMREDGEPHEPGKYTRDFLREAPSKKGDYIKVKKIL